MLSNARPSPATIGLVAGMGWQAGLLYERLLHEGTLTRRGTHRNAPLVSVAPVFGDLLALAEAGDWDGVGDLLSRCIGQLRAAGAEVVILSAVTAHLGLGRVDLHGLPLVHVADAVAAGCRARRVRRLGVLGTRFTLDSPVLTDALRERGVEPVLPGPAAAAALHALIVGVLEPREPDAAARAEALRVATLVIAALREAGAEAVLLGCTELPLALDAEGHALPILDAASLHAEAALEAAAAMAGAAVPTRTAA